MVTTTVGTDINSKPVTDTITINVTPAPVTVPEITSISEVTIDNDYKLPKLDYTSLEDLPAIDSSKVMLKVGYDGAAAGDAVAANTVEGVELFYCFQETGELLVADKDYDNLQFATSTYTNTLGIVAVAGDISAKTATGFTTEEVTLTAVFNRENVIGGTAVSDIDLADFDVYIKVGNGENQKLDNADVTFQFLNTSGNTITTIPASGEAKVKVTYMGVSNNDGTGSLIPLTIVPAPVDYAFKSVTFKTDYPGTLYKMDYSTAPSVTADGVLSAVVITADGEELKDQPTTPSWTGISVGYYSAENVEAAIAAETTDFTAYENVYLGVTYKVGEEVVASYFAEVTLADPVINSITFVPTYLKVLDGSANTPMYNSEIEWTLTATPAEGKAFEVDPSAATYWIGGQPATYADVPKTVKDAEVKVLAVYGGKEATLQTVPAGKAFIDPAKIEVKATQTLLDNAWIDDLYSTAVTKADNEDTYYTVDYSKAIVGGDTDDVAAPTFTVSAPSSVAVLNATGNQVKVTVTYTDSTGDKAATEEYTVTFAAKAYVEGAPALKFIKDDGTTVDVSSTAGTYTYIVPGTYTFAEDFTDGLIDHGTSPVYSGAINWGEGSITSTGLTMQEGASGTVTIEYQTRTNAEPSTITYYIAASASHAN